MSAHITSFVILCLPRMRFVARDAVAALPGVEIHHCGDDGKIVATAESASEIQIGDALVKMQNAPGVVAANMIYHAAEDETDE